MEIRKILIFDSVFILGAVVSLLRYLYFKNKLKMLSLKYGKDTVPQNILNATMLPKTTGDADYDLCRYKLFLSSRQSLVFVTAVFVFALLIILFYRIWS